MIHPQRYVVVKEVNTKDDIWFKGGYPARFVRSPMRGYTMHGYKARKKIDTQKWNDQLLSLGPEKSWPAITH
jgi:hypothetical protein